MLRSRKQAQGLDVRCLRTIWETIWETILLSNVANLPEGQGIIPISLWHQGACGGGKWVSLDENNGNYCVALCRMETMGPMKRTQGGLKRKKLVFQTKAAVVRTAG